MRSFNWILLAIVICVQATAASDAAATGTINLTIESSPNGPTGEEKVRVHKADSPLLNGLVLKHQLDYFMNDTKNPAQVDAFMYRENAIVLSKAAELSKSTTSLDVKSGVYHIAVPVGPKSAVWLSNIKVDAGAAVDQKVTLLQNGSLKGSWTIDVSKKKVQTPDRMTNALGLVKDGHVWAMPASVDKQDFTFADVPPGTYALVFYSFWEECYWIHDNVTIQSGKETKLQINVRRASLGGMEVLFKDKNGKNADLNGLAMQSAVLVDEKWRLAVASTGSRFHSVGENQTVWQCWSNLPTQSGYLLFAEPKGYASINGFRLSARAPVLKPDPFFKDSKMFKDKMIEVYPCSNYSLQDPPKAAGATK